MELVTWVVGSGVKALDWKFKIFGGKSKIGGDTHWGLGSLPFNPMTHYFDTSPIQLAIRVLNFVFISASHIFGIGLDTAYCWKLKTENIATK